jgi:hypothetical protein
LLPRIVGRPGAWDGLEGRDGLWGLRHRRTLRLSRSAVLNAHHRTGVLPCIPRVVSGSGARWGYGRRGRRGCFHRNLWGRSFRLHRGFNGFRGVRLEGKSPLCGLDRLDGFFRHGLDGFFSHRLDGFFRHGLDGFFRHGLDGFFRHRLDGFFSHRLDGFFRHRLDGFFSHRLDGFFSHRLDGFFSHRLGDFFGCRFSGQGAVGRSHDGCRRNFGGDVASGFRSGVGAGFGRGFLRSRVVGAASATTAATAGPATAVFRRHVGFRGWGEVVVIAQINGAFAGVEVVIVLGAFVLVIVIAIQVLIAVLGTATAPTAPATAATTTVSIVLPLAVVFPDVISVLFVLSAVVVGGLIDCVLVARATTTATAIALTFPGLLTAVRAVVAGVLILSVRGWAPTGAIAATSISPAAVAAATAVAVLRATFSFFIVLLILGL